MIAPAGPVTYDAPPADEQTARPDTGEQTGPQSTWGDWGAFGYGFANGGNHANPCGFWGYGGLYRGTYLTYNFILEHPIVRHVRSQVIDPIAANTWGYEAKPGAPQAWTDLVKDVMERLRFAFVNDAAGSGLDYGHAPFEKVWAYDGRYLVPERLKSLAPWNAGILADPHGNFAGVRWNGMPGDDLDVHKSFLFTYDGRFGRLHGRSRLENFRATAWRDWLDAATDMMRLSQKLSGIMPVVYTPTGQYKDTKTGLMVNWSDTALKAMQAAKAGLAIHLPHMAVMGNNGSLTATPGQANFEQFVALLKASAVRLEVIDFGKQGDAIAGILERMRHDEELMFAGYLRSPRTGMESLHGSKADAQQHTDTGDVNSENLALMIANAANYGIIDDLLVLNFGQGAKGAVRAVPSKLTDENRAVDNKILDGILADPVMRPQFLEQIDVNAITDRRSIPHDDTITLEEVASDPETPEDTSLLDGPDTQGD